MGRLLKQKLHMVQLQGITGFTKRVVKLAQTALLRSLLGLEDLLTGAFIKLIFRVGFVIKNSNSRIMG